MADEGRGRLPRGRPRSEQVRVAVLNATADLLSESGTDAVTVEAIAERAGVSKTTVYKWWPTRAHVMLESLFSRTRHTTDVLDGQSLADTLTTQLQALIAVFRGTDVGRLFAGIVAAAQSDPEIRAALHDQWLQPRREVGQALLRQAVDSGELDPDTDVAAAVDQLFAPVYHRLLMGHEPLDDALAGTLVRQLLAGLRVRR